MVFNVPMAGYPWVTLIQNAHRSEGSMCFLFCRDLLTERQAHISHIIVSLSETDMKRRSPGMVVRSSVMLMNTVILCSDSVLYRACIEV